MAQRKRRTFTREFKTEVVLETLTGESSQTELWGTSTQPQRRPGLKMKQQFLENAGSVFATTDQQSSEATERIAYLEPLVGRLTVALDIQKNIDFLELMPSQECEIAEALGSHYSVRQICEVLDFTRSNFYYQPKQYPYEHLLRDEIEKLASTYPTYGYRCITKLLVQKEYPVEYRRGPD